MDANVSSLRFVAWDTETTGTSPALDHLVEIAAIAFDEEFEHRRFESLIRPPIEIPRQARMIHGISDEMVRQAPGACLALERFFEFLDWSGSPRVLLAHNAGFDVGMVHGEWRRMGRARAPSGPEVVLDTCMLAKGLLPELKQHRLSSLVEHFKVEPGRLHRAMEDVRALKVVFLKLLGLAADRAATPGAGLTLGALVDLCGGYFTLNSRASAAEAFCLPPRIAALKELCGSGARVAIVYRGGSCSGDGEARYVTPLAIRHKGFRVYLEAFCHLENIKKTFRADRIEKVGEVVMPEAPC